MSKTKALHMLHTFWYIFVTTAGNYVQTSVSKHEKKICQHNFDKTWARTIVFRVALTPYDQLDFSQLKRVSCYRVYR